MRSVSFRLVVFRPAEKRAHVMGAGKGERENGGKGGGPILLVPEHFRMGIACFTGKKNWKGKEGHACFLSFCHCVLCRNVVHFQNGRLAVSKTLLLFLWSSWSDQNREQTAARPEPAALSLRTGQLISGSTRWSDADIYCFHPGKFYRRQISILRSTPARNLLTIKLFLTVIDSRLQELRMYICKRCTHIEIIVIIIIPSGWVAVPLG